MLSRAPEKTPELATRFYDPDEELESCELVARDTKLAGGLVPHNRKLNRIAVRIQVLLGANPSVFETKDLRKIKQ